MKWSLVTLSLLFMGQFDLSEFTTNAPVFGTIFFFTFMIVITMIMINLFVGIICDAFAAVSEADGEEVSGLSVETFIRENFFDDEIR